MKPLNAFFIGGTGRCGTNLVRELLALNEKVFSPPFEIRLFIDPDGLVDLYSYVKSSWTPQSIQIKLERVRKFVFSLAAKGAEGERYVDWELEKLFSDYKKKSEEFISKLIDFEFEGYWHRMKDRGTIPYTSYDIESVRNVIREYIISLLEDVINKDMFYVDDGTYNLFHAPGLSEILPEAKFLHMKRDPLQVIGSMKNDGWCPSNAGDVALWYGDSLNRIEEQLSLIPQDKLLVVNLEELRTEPMGEMKKICDFIGLRMDDPYIEEIGKFDLSRYRLYTFPPEEEREIKKVLGDIVNGENPNDPSGLI